MKKVITEEFNICSRHKTDEDRRKPFLRWAKKKAPDLYEGLLNGRVKFKDEWLAPIQSIRIVKRVVDENCPF